jgi:putative transcriptional regulator
MGTISKSLCGQFLVAGKRLRDPNFYRTVVLIVEHGDDGAMGLVVNEHFPLPETGEVVHIGGPVEPSALFILHNAGDFEDSERPVVPGLYVGSSADAFERIVRSASEGNSELKFRIFSGCAGWEGGQLEGELSRGDWYVHPATARLAFAEDPYVLWDLMLRKVHEAHRILPHAAKNPEWN